MARFYGSVKGQRDSEVHKIGNSISGLTAMCNGWNIGITVKARADKADDGKTDIDRIDIYLTGGSNQPEGTLIGSAIIHNGKPAFLKSKTA